MTRFRRRLGTIFIALGLLALAYGATIYFWKDPVTSIYAAWKQHQLNGELEESFATFQKSEDLELSSPEALAGSTASGSTGETTPTPQSDDPPTSADLQAIVHRAAEKYFRQLKPGEALGRLVVPKLDIDPVFVNGTKWGRDLSRGPGRYPETSLPGLGALTAIAGHRTTFGAWFRSINDLKQGDEIRVELPYGTFTYRVTGHEIVDDEDWSVIKPRGYETLVLSACHPLYSAKQRWIVYSRLQSVELPNGDTFDVDEPAPVAAAAP